VALVPGSTAGPYRIVEPLGRGGMASVYRAYEAALDRYVALKVLPREFLHDPTFAERFRREAQVIARLEHPNIVPIYAYDIDPGEGIPWMAMRLVAGGSLSQLLKGERPAFARTVGILRGVADALDYAHAKGIVHRDVKPQNVLLDEGGRVYLADFGIAKILESSGGLTATGMITGTPQYMAPEQATATKVDRRADIYALGIVAYEMLVGRVPFSADTPVAVLMKHLQEPLPLPPPSAVPEPLLRPLLKCTAKKPEDRWESAGAFVAALQGGLDAQTLPAFGETIDMRGPTAPTVVPAPTAAAAVTAPPPAAATRPAGASAAPPLPPTLRPQPLAAPPETAAKAPPPTAARAPSRPARRGAGTGALLAWGAAGLAVVVAATAGGVFLLMRGPATPSPTPTATTDVGREGREPSVPATPVPVATSLATSVPSLSPTVSPAASPPTSPPPSAARARRDGAVPALPVATPRSAPPAASAREPERSRVAEASAAREPAPRAPMPPAVDPEIQRLAGAVGQGDTASRWRATQALGSYGPAAAPAVLTLAEALADRSSEVRWRAAEALGLVGPAASSAVPALVRALGDTDPMVRTETAKALGRIGEAAAPAVSPLGEALRASDVAIRREAAKALAAIGRRSEPALRPLMDALKDKDRFVRASAARALGRIGPPAREAVPALTAMSRDSDVLLSREATAALQAIGAN
jgi:serine/threonine-protein kinase